ncbi:MAG: hypothetical protein LUC30_10485 [Clostridiales bacterium]|nr:hypothetical protein [Clostridiales bacterium]
MATIIDCAGQFINLDYLIRAYRDGSEIVLEMTGDFCLRVPLDEWDRVFGRDNVVQAFPVDGLYANYRSKEGPYQDKVLFMGVCANGEVRPMSGLLDGYVYFMDEGRNYEGLSDEILEEDPS